MKKIINILFLFVFIFIYAGCSLSSVKYEEVIDEIVYLDNGCIARYKNNKINVVYTPPNDWQITAFDWDIINDSYVITIKKETKEDGQVKLIQYVPQKHTTDVIKEESYTMGEGYYSIYDCKYTLSSKCVIIKQGYYESSGVDIIDINSKNSIFENKKIYFDDIYGFSSDSSTVYGFRSYSELEQPMDSYDETEIYTYNILTNEYNRTGYGQLESPALRIVDSLLYCYKDNTIYFYKYPNNKEFYAVKKRDYKISEWNPKHPIIIQTTSDGFFLCDIKRPREYLLKASKIDHYFVNWTPSGGAFFFLENRKIYCYFINPKNPEKSALIDYGYFAENDAKNWNCNLETINAVFSDDGKYSVINVGKKSYKELYLIDINNEKKLKIPISTDRFKIKWR